MMVMDESAKGMQPPNFSREELMRDSTVFIVDDEVSILHALTRILRQAGLSAKTFASAEEFLAEHAPGQHGCLLLDVFMPGMNGLELQKLLKERHSKIPVIILTGYGSVSMAVDAIKGGAIDFIEKPFEDDQLLDSVWHAIEIDARNRYALQRRAEITLRLEKLTAREREVMEFMIEGKSSKAIACLFGMSVRTCELHRARVMAKMEADSLADLVRMTIEASGLYT
ncbi:MAG: response regulator [Gallionella sp.]|nr:response regulator [Gallionella sp.]